MFPLKVGDKVYALYEITSESLAGVKGKTRVHAQRADVLYITQVNDKALYAYQVSKSVEGTEPFWVAPNEIMKVEE